LSDPASYSASNILYNRITRHLRSRLLAVIPMQNVTEDIQSEFCLIEQCGRKGFNLIALVTSDNLNQSPVYRHVCNLHYEELMSRYYEKSFGLQEKPLDQYS
jgi:hypothetical protein